MQRKITGLLLLLSSLMSAPGSVMATESSESSMRVVDPKLTRFVQAAVDANPRTQAARAALEASEAFMSAASRPLYNPGLSLDAENSDTDTRTVGLSQTLDVQESALDLRQILWRARFEWLAASGQIDQGLGMETIR